MRWENRLDRILSAITIVGRKIYKNVEIKIKG